MKKMWKKVSAVLLAFAMCIIALPLTAAAANGDYTLTFEPHEGHTYKVYQLLTGDVSQDGTKLSNAQMGDNAIKVKDGIAVTAQGIIEAMEAVKNSSEIAQGKEALNWVNLESDPFAVITTETEGDVTVPGGYYVITDEYIDGAEQDRTLSATILKVLADKTVTPKDNTIPTVPEKEVEDADGNPVDAVSIGDVLTYTLSGTIPSMEHYETYKYQMVDTMSKGLATEVVVGDTFEAPLMKNGEKKGNATFKVTEKTTGTDGTTTLRFDLVDAIGYKGLAGAEFSFSYEATVTVDAPMHAAITNKVKVEYSSNPNNDGDPLGKTTETVVTVYTTELIITKHDGDGAILTGAEFELEGTSVNVGYVTGRKFEEYASGEEDEPGNVWYKLVDNAYTQAAPTAENANKYADVNKKYKLEVIDEAVHSEETPTKARAFVDKNGKVTFSGLGAGTYTLTEVTTPDGYNTIDPITFTVEFDAEKKKFVVEMDDNSKFEIEVQDDNSLTTTIVNLSGSLLPSTGGIGTTIFYVVGGILVVAAVVLLVTKKRMSSRS